MGNQFIIVLQRSHEQRQLVVAVLDEAGHEVHVGGVQQVPVLDAVHVPVQGPGVVDEVQQPPEGLAVHILDVHGPVVVAGQEAVELGLEEGAGDGEDEFVGGDGAAVGQLEGELRVIVVN